MEVLIVSVVFGFQKVGKHLFPTPADSTLGCPSIVIVAIAANIEHYVQCWRASEHLASWPSRSLWVTNKEADG